MPEYKLSLTLLSFFTTTNRALEIQGDLLEESQDKGRLWFYRHVLWTTLALYCRAFMKNPVRNLLLGVVLGECLFFVLWFGPGLINRPLRQFPDFLTWVSYREEYFLFILMPLLSHIYGFTLVNIASRAGMQTLVSSLIVFMSLLVTLVASSFLTINNPVEAPLVSALMLLGAGTAYILLLVLLPMLMGAIQVFRRKEEIQARMA